MNLTERKEREVTVIELEGEADLATVPAFQTTMRDKMKENLEHLLLDFTRVTFVNTPVWAVVIEYFRHAQENESTLAVVGLRDRVEASFNIVRLGDFIPHYATANEALDALGVSG
jgi:anti-anti-sigma factor